MKKSIVVGLHVGFWLCYLAVIVVLVYLSLSGEDQSNANVEKAIKRVDFFVVIPSIISYYSFYFIIFPYVRQKRFVLSTVCAIGIAVGASLIGTALIYIFLGADSLTEAEESVSIGVIFVSCVTLVIGVVALVTRGFITWFDEIKVKEELQQKNHEVEMALVKSQLDPHFLFNTLNNIDILILKDADKASDYLNKLSDIMRFMLFEAKAEKVLLSKEIEYIEKYIALQRKRTANPNYVNFKVSGSQLGKTIAPMVFLPFIENAFKHATNKKLDNTISIRIIIEDRSTILECTNKFDPNRKPKQGDGGLGNDLIERRLNLIYPEHHTLEVMKGDEQYRVSLTISQ